MTFLLPDHKQAALTSHMIQGSTVTVVLLTLEALVVVFVADVVLATYPARHLDHKEAKDVESRHHYSASLGEIQLMCLSQTSNNSHLCHCLLYTSPSPRD